ncbi:MAG TPA: hypothetical protein VMT64_10975, partial [Candidatus Binataceae bacterium]|nr:hypothetical protein [Candidatus Binataceae bacterium]
TEGYDGGAWFLDESPRKAIIRTRCGGSSGPCLFYLDLKKRALQPISDDIFMEGEPVFTDIDGDGADEILIPGRGRDRTARQGGALLRWTGSTYKIWWPRLSKPLYVVYAQLLDLDQDPRNEIIAILDPKGLSSQRELGIWRLDERAWKERAKVKLPNNTADGDAEIGSGAPTFAGIEHNDGAIIIKLDYGEEYSAVSCRYGGSGLECPAVLKSKP